ncbi:MAG: ornithine cyclodeaminase family protein, partial [Sciscionella sp.]
VDSGALSMETLHAELGQIVAGARPGRQTAQERILLWHRGLSILDIAVGELILRKAEAAELGTLVRYR